MLILALLCRKQRLSVAADKRKFAHLLQSQIRRKLGKRRKKRRRENAAAPYRVHIFFSASYTAYTRSKQNDTN